MQSHSVGKFGEVPKHQFKEVFSHNNEIFFRLFRGSAEAHEHHEDVTIYVKWRLKWNRNDPWDIIGHSDDIRRPAWNETLEK